MRYILIIISLTVIYMYMKRKRNGVKRARREISYGDIETLLSEITGGKKR